MRVQAVLTSIGESGVDRVVLRIWDLSRRSQWLAGILGFGGVLVALCGVLLAGSPRRALAPPRAGPAGRRRWPSSCCSGGRRAIVGPVPARRAGQGAPPPACGTRSPPRFGPGPSSWAGSASSSRPPASPSWSGSSPARPRAGSWPGSSARSRGTRDRLLRGAVLVAIGGFALLRPAERRFAARHGRGRASGFRRAPVSSSRSCRARRATPDRSARGEAARRAGFRVAVGARPGRGPGGGDRLVRAAPARARARRRRRLQRRAGAVRAAPGRGRLPGHATTRCPRPT